jgi:phosphoribosyl-ATP pyrophosphohydrolase/phosphoribosyl-AMP cyclohydrolase
MTKFNVNEIDFSKGDGLVPAIVQDADTQAVLMLGYMNAAALEQTLRTGQVTFFSRTKQALWTKGETSGNVLLLCSIDTDCDQDTLLLQVRPAGPVCHTGNRSCFAATQEQNFLYRLERKIRQRIAEDVPGSYTNALFRRGINKVAQKLGEEAVELVIEAKDNNKTLFLNEAADLLYHLLLLLYAKEVQLREVEAVLLERA